MKTCSLSLHAPSNGFSPQDVRGLIFTDRTAAFLHQENNELRLLINGLISLYEQASSHTS
jgi:hypothetical protein